MQSEELLKFPSPIINYVFIMLTLIGCSLVAVGIIKKNKFLEELALLPLTPVVIYFIYTLFTTPIPTPQPKDETTLFEERYQDEKMSKELEKERQEKEKRYQEYKRQREAQENKERNNNE